MQKMSLLSLVKNKQLKLLLAYLYILRSSEQLSIFSESKRVLPVQERHSKFLFAQTNLNINPINNDGGDCLRWVSI